MHLSKESLGYITDSAWVYQLVRIKMLRTHFEESRMSEDDNIVVFIVSWKKSIPKKNWWGNFTVITHEIQAKVATIEEAKDMTKMIQDDLLGSLQTYKMNLDTLSKDKSI